MVLWILLGLNSFSRTGLSPSIADCSKVFPVTIQFRVQSEPRSARTAVWALPRSLAATYGITVVFSSSAYLDVSVQRVPGCTLWIHAQSLQLFCSRFPHSEICGSIDICSSPQLIAAYHVLHRLLVPRHPPYALFCLTSYMFSSVRTCGLVALLSQSIRLYFGYDLRRITSDV